MKQLERLSPKPLRLRGNYVSKPILYEKRFLKLLLSNIFVGFLWLIIGLIYTCSRDITFMSIHFLFWVCQTAAAKVHLKESIVYFCFESKISSLTVFVRTAELLKLFVEQCVLHCTYRHVYQTQDEIMKCLASISL